MSHIHYWKQKIEKGLKLPFDFNTNLNEKQWFQGMKNKQALIRMDQRSNERYFPSGHEWSKNVIAYVNAGIYLTNNKYIIPELIIDNVEIIDFFESHQELFIEELNEQNIKIMENISSQKRSN